MVYEYMYNEPLFGRFIVFCFSKGYSQLRRSQRALLQTEGTHSDLICQITYIVLAVITVLFAISCIILIAVFFSSTGLVVNYLEKQPGGENASTSSIPNAARALYSHLTSFLDNGISGGQEMTNTTVYEFIALVEVSYTL